MGEDEVIDAHLQAVLIEQYQDDKHAADVTGERDHALYDAYGYGKCHEEEDALESLPPSGSDVPSLAANA